MQRILATGLRVIKGEVRPWVFRLALLLAIISAGPIIFNLLKHGSGLIDNYKSKVLGIINSSLPDNFELSIKGGTAKVNQTEPFYVVVSQSQLAGLNSFGKTTNIKKQTISQIRLLTIDTNAKVEDFERYQTLYLINKNSLVYTKNGNVTVSSLGGSKDMLVTKKLLVDKINLYTTGKYKTWETVGLWLLPFLIIVFLTLTQLVVWAGQAFIVWLIGKTIRANVGFGRALSLLVYLTVVVDVLSVLLGYIKPLNAYVSFFVDVWALGIIVFSYYLLNLHKQQNEI